MNLIKNVWNWILIFFGFKKKEIEGGLVKPLTKESNGTINNVFPEESKLVTIAELDKDIHWSEQTKKDGVIRAEIQTKSLLRELEPLEYTTKYGLIKLEGENLNKVDINELIPDLNDLEKRIKLQRMKQERELNTIVFEEPVKEEVASFPTTPVESTEIVNRPKPKRRYNKRKPKVNREGSMTEKPKVADVVEPTKPKNNNRKKK